MKEVSMSGSDPEWMHCEQNYERNQGFLPQSVIVLFFTLIFLPFSQPFTFTLVHFSRISLVIFAFHHVFMLSFCYSTHASHEFL